MWKYREGKLGGDVLFMQTNHGVIIEMLFEGADYPTAMYINGDEFKPSWEANTGLFVGIRQEIISLRDLIVRACLAYPLIMREVVAEGDDLDDHIAYESKAWRFV